MYQTIGFIGTGNMGSAIAKAAAKSGQAETILLANRTPAKAAALAAELPGGTLSTNEEIARTAKLIFLGVKPQMMQLVLDPLEPILRKREDRFILVTMAAGLTCDRIQDMVDLDCPVIRIMPNTPVSIGAGMVQYACSENVADSDLQAFLGAFAWAGRFSSIPEFRMDAGSAVSACGPAFADIFLEAMADAAWSVHDHFKGKAAYLNIMKNMSVDCDCCAVAADPKIGDIGILASLDPVALDQACLDLVYASDDPGKADLIERIESLHGVHTVEAAADLGIGTREYELITLD